MIRPWQVWLAFALGAAVVLGAIGWASWTAVHLDRAKADALRKGALEENVRLALWRMDSSLSSLVAQENGRPYFLYTPFYPAERAYTRMFAELQSSEVLIPSPLLTFESPDVRLHFQISPDGGFCSPQVPTANMRDLAEVKFSKSERIEAAAALLSQLRKRVKFADLAARLPQGALRSSLAAARLPPSPRPQVQSDEQEEPAAQQLATRYQSSSQTRISQNEQRVRQDAQVMLNTQAVDNPNWFQTETINEGFLQPLWLDGELILARRVHADGKTWFQGCWLDWPRIQTNLLATVRDLLPDARLEPVAAPLAADDTHLLTALPVRLLPGALTPGRTNGVTPVQLSLIVAWLALLAAAVVVALVLWQALALSERRGAFVSAVTHELRTPLTTFRLYTELLAEGDRVPAEKRRAYVETLRREADRLGHLVENVLSYARLERKRTGGRLQDIALAALLDRTRARLADRAAQAGMTLEVDTSPSPGGRGQGEGDGALIRVDPEAAEQILFNLVDNACKYAAAAQDKTIRIAASIDGDGPRAQISVRDFGPGLRDSRRLFQPFSRAAQEAAGNAPGVGLGLALSRRLARAMGGDLTWDHSVADGARFVLTLPRA
jgi:signal transduction histidine kinase